MQLQSKTREGRTDEGLLSASMTRRDVIRRGLAVGLAIPAAGSILAACEVEAERGEDDVVVDDTAADDHVTVESDDDDVVVEPDEEGDDDVEDEPDDDDVDIDHEVEVDPDYESVIGEDYEPPRNFGGQIVVGGVDDPPTLNPVVAQDTWSREVISMMMNGLITDHPLTEEPHPELAESWDISDDGLVYTFYLRQDVTWHDGEQLTARDVVFTYDLHMNEETGSVETPELTSRLSSVEAIDDYTVQATLNVPASPFLQLNCWYRVVPEHILGDVAPAEIAAHEFSAGTPGVTIGCGPFQLYEWIRGEQLTLEKYPDYYHGEPHVDQLIVRFFTYGDQLRNELAAGGLDYGQVPSAEFDRFDAINEVDVTVEDTHGFIFYGYQLDEGRAMLFQETEVRQALLYALDRQAMVDEVEFGFAEVATGTMPVRSWAYNPGGIERRYEYDPDRARQILDEAGWNEREDGIREKNGLPLLFVLNTNVGPQQEQLAEMMREQWREIGVECVPEFEEWGEFLERVSVQRDFDIMMTGFSWGIDPHQEVMWHSQGGLNVNGYSNPVVDELLAQGLATEDRDERIEIYTEMQNVLMEDLPSAILYFPQRIVVVNERLHNAFYGTVNAHEWWVDE